MLTSWSRQGKETQNANGRNNQAALPPPISVGGVWGGVRFTFLCFPLPVSNEADLVCQNWCEPGESRGTCNVQRTGKGGKSCHRSAGGGTRESHVLYIQPTSSSL